MAPRTPSTSFTPPPMLDVLKKLKQNTMSEMRCCLPATVTAVDSDLGTVDAMIAVKYKKATGEYADYPALSALPAITLQGGGVAARFPVQNGDQCLVFFADRAMDAWKGSGTAQPLPNNRMHDLSDGFALVGVNSFNKVLDLFLEDSEGGIATEDAKIAIDRETGMVVLKVNASDARVTLNNVTGKVRIANNPQSLLTVLTDLNTALTSLVTVLNGLTTTGGPTTQTISAATVAALVPVQTAITAVQTKVTGLLE